MLSKFNKKQYSNKMFKAREIDGEVLFFGINELKKKDDSNNVVGLGSNNKKKRRQKSF